jgi:hypothetical protein
VFKTTLPACPLPQPANYVVDQAEELLRDIISSWKHVIEGIEEEDSLARFASIRATDL